MCSYSLNNKSWPSLDVLNSRTQLDKLRKTLEGSTGDDSEVEAALCRFLVVRSCGHIELSLEQGLLDCLEGSTAPHVHRYIRSGMFKGRNPKPDRIEKLLGDFHSEWRTQIKNALDENDEILRRELAFLVQKRNKIAHGQSDGIGKRKALDLCNYAIELSDKILQILSPESNFARK